MTSETNSGRGDVTWEAAREHLRRRLMIDDEWRFDADDAFTWWPWFLAQHVSVTGRASYPNDDGISDTMLWITSRTDVLHADNEDLGLSIVATAIDLFPYGAFIYDDSLVYATSS